MDGSVRIASVPLTLSDYLHLPETQRPVEVVEGQPVMAPAPGGLHQRAVRQLLRLLDDACPHGFEALPGPLDWVLRETPLLVRQPDVVVVTHEQAARPRLSSPPLLAVEVLSPESIERDVVTKGHQYARAGLAHYWNRPGRPRGRRLPGPASCGRPPAPWASSVCSWPSRSPSPWLRRS